MSEPMVQYLENMFRPDGWGSKLLTPIGKVRLYLASHGEAFRNFAEEFITGETFCVEDMILASETGKERAPVLGRPGDGIFLLENAQSIEPRMMRVLMARSAPGIAGLVRVCPGASLEKPANCDVNTFARARFFLLPDREASAIEKAYAQMGQSHLVRAGTVLPDVLAYEENGKTLWERPAASVYPQNAVGLEIGDDCDGEFTDGARSALSYYAFADLKLNMFFHFPEELPLPQLLAAELGVFDVLSAYPTHMQPVRFAPGGTVSLVVPRLYPAAGDRLFALRPKSDGGRPIPEELRKLREYLASALNEGTIKGVLPLKRNTLAMLDNLCGEELTYAPLREFPNGFAVLALAGRNAECPGLEVGNIQFR